MKDSKKSGISNPKLRKALACCLLLSVYSLTPASYGIAPVAYSAPAWVRQNSGTMAWLHSVYFVDGMRGWAVGGKGALLVTEDGGARWQQRPAPTEDSLRDVFFADARTGWLVCERSIYMLRTKEESRSYLMKTTDGGDSWTRVDVTGADVDARLVGVRFADALRGWAFGELGALYSTTDGGQSWARQRVPTRHLLLGGAFLDARTGWLAGAGSTLLHTEDGGETWREGELSGAGTQSPQQASPSREQAPAQQTSWPSKQAQPSSQPSANERRAPGVRFNAVSFADSRRGWAVGSGGAVYATTNGGRTWRAQASNVASDLYDVKFLNEREGWAVGGEGTVIHTTDGGATWNLEPPRTPHTLERLFFAGPSRGWAVGFGGTIIAFKK